MGIIYSVVLELTNPYYLKSKRIWYPWNSMKEHFLGRPLGDLMSEMQRQLKYRDIPFLLDITVLLDGRYPLCFIEGREITNEQISTPKYDLRNDIMDELVFKHSDWIGILHGDAGQIGHRLNGLSDDEVKSITEFVFTKALQPYQFQGEWWYVMWSSDSGLRVHSSEYAFDATSPDYLDFVDEVRRLGSRPYIPGTLTLRFQRKSAAFLSMQRYPETVLVEISAPIGYEPVKDFMEAVDRIARRHRGIPHWGQAHAITPREVKNIYGKDFRKWLKVLRTLSKHGHASTFSNSFTRERGLEPHVSDSLLLFG